MRLTFFGFLIFGSVISYAQDLAMHVKRDDGFSYNAVVPVAAHFAPVNMPGTRMRNAGRTLTIAGIPLLIGGIIIASSAESTH